MTIETLYLLYLLGAFLLSVAAIALAAVSCAVNIFVKEELFPADAITVA